MSPAQRKSVELFSLFTLKSIFNFAQILRWFQQKMVEIDNSEYLVKLLQRDLSNFSVALSNCSARNAKTTNIGRDSISLSS